MKAEQNCGGPDLFRPAAAVLVVAIHTSPLLSYNAEADFFLTRILARIAVPFFFMATGQFAVSDFLNGGKTAGPRLAGYLKKICLLYGIAALLYLPAGVYAGHFQKLSLCGILRMVFFDGTFYHLWYFPACIIGILLVCLMSRFLSLSSMTVTAAALYAAGLLGDGYYGLTESLPVIGPAYSGMFKIFTYTRNGLFFAPFFLILGVRMKVSAPDRLRRLLCPGLAVSFAAMAAESFLLHNLGLPRHDSMYVMLPPTMYFLYRLLLQSKAADRRSLRTVSAWIYILHPAVILTVRFAGRLLHLAPLLVENSLIHFLLVTLLSVLVSLLPERLISRRRQEACGRDRAWIELDQTALARNVRFLQSRLPETCALMPAVKADAYGHGAVVISRELNRLGIRAFCVASIGEGIRLRRSRIRGTILILGYTHPDKLDLLRRYRLTQTVVDYDYARMLCRYGKKLHVHVGIDTGMRRLGEPAENIEQIRAVFEMKNLRIDGLFSHQCAADSQAPDARAFTKKQTDAFLNLTASLKAQGYKVPKVHLLSSYGVLEHPDPIGDYARVGIALYGVLSARADTCRLGSSLTPVLSLKARIASVRSLKQKETAGYGMAFTAPHDMKIAAIAVGYGDGLPRALSCGAGFVLINGQKAPIVGRVCMDMTLVDVTEISDVKAGDICVVIGTSGRESVTAADLAGEAGTIANEILSRLGGRLNRFLV